SPDCTRIPSHAAGVYRKYDATWAVKYALANFKNSYGKSNPFPDLSIEEDCTHFISQVIAAGLMGTASPRVVYDNIANYSTDFGSSNGPQWYWLSSTYRGAAWAGANQLYQYAKNNKTTYRGLHFQFVTNDSRTAFMDYDKVQVGDIIFADWENDGIINHSMVVNEVVSKAKRAVFRQHAGYNSIRLTMQSYDQS